jgi:hypothetical protein
MLHSGEGRPLSVGAAGVGGIGDGEEEAGTVSSRGR